MKGKKRKIGFTYAWSGIVAAAKTELNFKIHLVCGILAVLLGFILKLSPLEWVILLIVINAVLVAELFNTVIEEIIDYVKPELHPTAKYIKDVAAGAVLLTAITAVIIGCLLYIPKLIQFL